MARYLSRLTATIVRMDVTVTASVKIILQSQAISPKCQGYWCHIVYISSGITEKKKNKRRELKEHLGDDFPGLIEGAAHGGGESKGLADGQVPLQADGHNRQDGRDGNSLGEDHFAVAGNLSKVPGVLVPHCVHLQRHH